MAELRMLAFDEPVTEVATDLDEVVTEIVYPVFTQASVGSTGKMHLISSNWTWRELRDYVIAGIVAANGAFPRNPVTEASIFKSFIDRWPDQAEAIARYAVEEAKCWWASAPLSVNRFCLASDPYFAAPIAERLA